MTIIVPKDYHLRRVLADHQVSCVDSATAQKEDIRALRIGILNIMPKAESYEFSLLHPLGRSIMQIEPVWIRLTTHKYSSSDWDHLQSLYVPFPEAIKSAPLDGLILTGAPVEEIPFEEVIYWNEITAILSYARAHIPSTLGICWGGLALAKMLGIDKIMFKEKLFGVFETRNLDVRHPITGDLDDLFWCPQSRHSGISDEAILQAKERGTINPLAYADEGGYTIFESSDHRYLMHLGHPEYNAQRLVDEYNRDVKAGRSDVPPPRNLDVKKPLNRWKGQGSEFISQWIKYLHNSVKFSEALDYAI